MAAAPTSGLPSTVGRYVLYGEIASGGMATVHFGRLQGAAGFTRSVAIKRLHPQFAKDPDFVAMFVDEARLAARIAHPNVVPTLDVVSQQDELLLVMEYVRGAPLSRLLRLVAHGGERVPVRIATAIVSGMLQGLHAAHEARSETGESLDIVHRDVSPQNVLVGTDGVARVLDFGVAKAAGRWQSTREGQLKGKIAYMAPEQITTGIVTRRTDVYAAAVVLWETLTTKRLFRADNEARLLAMVLEGEVPAASDVVPGLTPGFDHIVRRGLHRDPEMRFATAREMAFEIEAVVGAAAPTEVGEWVERVAAEELRDRASRVEAIERGIPSAEPSASGLSARRAVATKSGVVRPAAVGRHDDASQQSHIAVVQADAPSPQVRPGFGSARKRWLGVAAAMVLVAAAGIVALRPAPPPTPIAPRAPEAAAASASAVAAPFPTGWTASTGAPSSATPTATASAAPGASARTDPPARTPPTQQSPKVWKRAPPARSPGTGQDCTPPYTADRLGHVHFKPECL